MSVESSYNEPRLIRKLKKGDKAAFESIFNKYKEKLYFYTFSFLHSKHETEEIVQNVFVSLWEFRNRLDDKLSIKNYLYKITINKIYNYLKHSSIHQKYVNFNLAYSTEVDDLPQKTIYSDNIKEVIESFIARLPEKQRQIFRMSRWQGLSNNDIAKQLNISVRSVENQVYRALKFIKENLKEEYSI